MALPSSGALSLSMVNTELNKSASSAISMNDADVRKLFGKASGVISLSDGYSKANVPVYINTSNRTGANIFELMGSPTQPNTYIFENQATISAGTGSYALRTGVFPAGSTLKIVNKGYIRGRGGNGGPYNAAGGPGGSALYIDMGCTIDNGSGYIFGGGGGGGGAYLTLEEFDYVDQDAFCPGGGGAGSNGGSVVGMMYQGAAQQMVTVATPSAGSPDSGGTGGYYYWSANSSCYAKAGNGGNPGTAGVAGKAVRSAGYMDYAYSGGSAGAAITRNGNTVSIIAGNNTTQIKGAIV